MHPCAVVVHGFREVLEQIEDSLQHSGYRVFTTTDPLGAVDLINRHTPDILITSPEFGPGKLGGRVLARLAKLRCKAALVVFVGSGASRAHIAKQIADLRLNFVIPSPRSSLSALARAAIQSSAN